MRTWCRKRTVDQVRDQIVGESPRQPVNLAQDQYFRAGILQRESEIIKEACRLFIIGLLILPAEALALWLGRGASSTSQPSVSFRAEYSGALTALGLLLTASALITPLALKIHDRVVSSRAGRPDADLTIVEYSFIVRLFASGIGVLAPMLASAYVVGVMPNRVAVPELAMAWVLAVLICVSAATNADLVDLGKECLKAIDRDRRDAKKSILLESSENFSSRFREASPLRVARSLFWLLLLSLIIGSALHLLWLWVHLQFASGVNMGVSSILLFTFAFILYLSVFVTVRVGFASRDVIQVLAALVVFVAWIVGQLDLAASRNEWPFFFWVIIGNVVSIVSIWVLALRSIERSQFLGVISLRRMTAWWLYMNARRI